MYAGNPDHIYPPNPSPRDCEAELTETEKENTHLKEMEGECKENYCNELVVAFLISH